MEIVLIRHGQPEWVRDGLNVINPPLTDLGHQQAELMAARLAAQHDPGPVDFGPVDFGPFDEVLVSPLLRARQTAAPLYERLGRPEVVDDWLEEIRDPGWHGTPAEKAEQAYRELRERPVDQRWHGLDGGESIRGFVDRIRLGATLFLKEREIQRIDHELPIWSIAQPDTKIAIVAHAGTNTVFINHLLGLEPTPWEWDRFVIGHASVSRLEALPVHDGYTFSLTSLSSVEHLPTEMRTY